MAELIGGWRTGAVLLSCECATYSACGRDTDGEQVHDCPERTRHFSGQSLVGAGWFCFTAPCSPLTASSLSAGGRGGGSGQEKGYISKKGLATGADLKCE